MSFLDCKVTTSFVIIKTSVDSRNESKLDLAGAAEPSLDREGNLGEADAGALSDETALALAFVARMDRTDELDMLDAREEGPQSLHQLVLDYDSAALGHDFAEDVERDGTAVGGIAADKEVVRLDGIFGVPDSFFFVEPHLLYQEHGLAVREYGLDFFGAIYESFGWRLVSLRKESCHC